MKTGLRVGKFAEVTIGYNSESIVYLSHKSGANRYRCKNDGFLGFETSILKTELKPLSKRRKKDIIDIIEHAKRTQEFYEKALKQLEE